MRALIYDGVLQMREVPAPVPVKGEALVRVLLAGICNTDLEINKGYMGFRGIPGHEFIGIVERASNPHFVGKRVVGEINCVCGACRYCLMEMPHHCSSRTVLGIAGRDGAFAEYLTLPEDNLHIVPNAMRDDVAVFTEPTAAAFRITQQLSVTDSDRIIVLGDGKLGQLAAQVLFTRTRKMLCIGRHAWKRKLLEDLRIPTADVDEEVEGGADIVVEATGSQSGLERALSLVRPEGTVVLKTTIAGETSAALSGAVVDEVRILGSRCGPFRPALDALALGSVEVRPLITATYGLDDAVQAFEHASQSGVMKVLIAM